MSRTCSLSLSLSLSFCSSLGRAVPEKEKEGSGWATVVKRQILLGIIRHAVNAPVQYGSSAKSQDDEGDRSQVQLPAISAADTRERGPAAERA